uniref:Uncharacterized protein n=1 Tax=Arundo donax TaxID=35708 RepID=A0A0A8ZZR4_ARUDO
MKHAHSSSLALSLYLCFVLCLSLFPNDNNMSFSPFSILFNADNNMECIVHAENRNPNRH